MRFCVLLLLAASALGNPPRVINLGTRFVPGYQNQYSELVARILRSRGIRVYSVYDIANIRRSSLSQGGVFFGDSPIGSGLDSTFIRSSAVPGGSSLTYQELYSGAGGSVGPAGPVGYIPDGVGPDYLPGDVGRTFVRSSTSSVRPSIGYDELYRDVDVGGPSIAPIPVDSGSDLGPLDGPGAGVGPVGPGGDLGPDGSGGFSLPSELVGGGGLSGGLDGPGFGPATAGLSDLDGPGFGSAGVGLSGDFGAGADVVTRTSTSTRTNLIPYSSSSTSTYRDLPGPYSDIDEYRPYLGGGSSVYRERYYDSGPRFGSGAADDYFLGGGPIIGESGFGSLSGSSSFDYLRGSGDSGLDYLRGSGDSGLDYLRGSGGSGLDYIDSGDYIPGGGSSSVYRGSTGFPSSYYVRRSYSLPQTYYGPRVTSVRRTYTSPGYGIGFSTYGDGVRGGGRFQQYF
ncbi:PE-PGRS family protein PE_PGRS4-like isoform X1 [Saccostrea cucullata]|uniref:PE-PGRS family protein PE_PGRS4-like isoform X1 n=1 Tax=Saccostrea cuccullata TaxID=36930 RepID=UPI002ED5CD22